MEFDNTPMAFFGNSYYNLAKDNYYKELAI